MKAPFWMRLRCRVWHKSRRFRWGRFAVQWEGSAPCEASGLCWTCCETYREFSCENIRKAYPV